MARARRTWSALSPSQRAAAAASLCLVIATALPWYRRSERGASHAATVVSALVSEPALAAAIIVVSLFVIGAMLARGDGLAFHLPGGDARVVMFAGIWTAALVIAAMVRIPGVRGLASADTSQTLWWGCGVALAGAIALVACGWRMRRAPLLSLPTR